MYAPYWKGDARGVIAGLTHFVNKGHIARAVLEATAFQVREVVDAMAKDSGITLDVLRADGGMVVNDLLMQFQSDILAKPVVRPMVKETTALGAGYLAGWQAGLYPPPDEFAKTWRRQASFTPSMAASERESRYHGWRDAVARTILQPEI